MATIKQKQIKKQHNAKNKQANKKDIALTIIVCNGMACIAESHEFESPSKSVDWPGSKQFGWSHHRLTDASRTAREGFVVCLRKNFVFFASCWDWLQFKQILFENPHQKHSPKYNNKQQHTEQTSKQANKQAKQAKQAKQSSKQAQQSSKQTSTHKVSVKKAKTNAKIQVIAKKMQHKHYYCICDQKTVLCTLPCGKCGWI